MFAMMPFIKRPGSSFKCGQEYFVLCHQAQAKTVPRRMPAPTRRMIRSVRAISEISITFHASRITHLPFLLSLILILLLSFLVLNLNLMFGCGFAARFLSRLCGYSQIRVHPRHPWSNLPSSPTSAIGSSAIGYSLAHHHRLNPWNLIRHWVPGPARSTQAPCPDGGNAKTTNTS